MKKIIISAIPALAIAFFLFYNPNSNNNQRENQEEESERESLPTLDEALTELRTEEVQAPTDSESREVQTGDTVTVQYRGWLASNGTVFDESYSRGDEGFTFTVGSGVIEGWSEGVVGMRVGEIRRLFIPAEKGYGSTANGSIPANSDLIFDVEMLSFGE